MKRGRARILRIEKWYFGKGRIIKLKDGFILL